MVKFSCFFCILGVFFCQLCLIYSESLCRDVYAAEGTISDAYRVRGVSLYHRCWIIRKPDKYPLHIQLISLNLHNKPASDGSLTMEMKSESKVLKYWSQYQMDNFTTTSSDVEVHFRVNSAQFPNGVITNFTLHFNHICDSILTESTGYLSSPNYPGFYPIRSLCVYKIRLSPGYLINITFYNVRINKIEDNCDGDYLEVRDGDNEDSPLIDKFCGQFMSYPIISTQNNLWIKFVSQFMDRGFYATYSAIEMASYDCNLKDSFHCSNTTCVPMSKVCDGIKNCENAADETDCAHNNCTGEGRFHCSNDTCVPKSEVCNGIKNCENGADEFGCACDKVYTKPTGNIRSPFYPDLYPAQSQCIYEILLSPGYLINITFHDVEMESSTHCNYDHLQIRDGKENSSLIAQICGKNVPNSIISTQNYLWMKFKTDASIQKRGFSAVYTAIKKDAEAPLPTTPASYDEKESDVEKIIEKPEENLQASLAEDDLESDTKTQKLCSCVNGTRESVENDSVKMDVEEHKRRIEVFELQKKYETERIEFQKKYETDRIEFQKVLESEKLKKIRFETESLRLLFAEREAEKTNTTR